MNKIISTFTGQSRLYAIVLLFVMAWITSMVVSCSSAEEVEPVKHVYSTIVKPYTIIFAGEDIEPRNGKSTVMITLVRDYLGDTLAIYSNGQTGGIQIINMTQKRADVKESK